ncbi:MAG: BatA domain-containing protein [Mariniphaga sp.]
MKFLFPTFLFALLAIAIPVIIHLFRFRRYKTVYFSHVGFLKNIKKESRKRSQLKQLLMLLARIFTIVFLVFAFAQPYIPETDTTLTGGVDVVGVYVDNSFSMIALSEQGQLLEHARNKAVEIAQSYPPGTRFRLFTNDMEPRHQHVLNRDQFIRFAADIKSSPATVPLSVIHNRFDVYQTSEVEKVKNILYCISDFQRNSSDIENFTNGSAHSYFMPLIPNQVNNLFIDSCWVEVPAHGLNQEEIVYVKIKNNSDEDYQNLPLRLYLNDSLKSMTNFSIHARNEITASLQYRNLSSGIQLGKVEITDYPFTHDNSWFLSYFVEPELKALAVYQDGQRSKEGIHYISALFEQDDYVNLETMDVKSLQISKLSESNAVFLLNPGEFSTGLLNELELAVRKGTSVILFPQLSRQGSVSNQLLSKLGANIITGLDTTSQEISGIDFDNRFFQHVFLERNENARFPVIKQHVKFSGNIRTNETNLLWFRNGDKALSFLPYHQGKLWVFAFPLDHTTATFARDIVFVPSIYNIVLNSLTNQQISYTIGQQSTYFLSGNKEVNLDSPIEVEHRETGEAFIPGVHISDQAVRLDMGNVIRDAGHYLVKNDGTPLSSLSFNYNRSESTLTYYTPDELERQIEQSIPGKASVIANVTAGFADILQEIQTGKQGWRWCVLISLFFMLAEVLIARFWKQ